MFRALASCSLSNLSAPAGTPITGLVPPLRAAWTRLTRILYRCGATPHTVTVAKALWQTTLSASAVSGATSVALAADNGAATPAGALAAGDWLCLELGNGTYYLAQASAVSTLTVALAALPAAAALGNKVWSFGAVDDHESSQTNLAANPLVGSQFVADAGRNEWGDPASGICCTLREEQPLMLHSDNPGVAGRFDLISAAYAAN